MKEDRKYILIPAADITKTMVNNAIETSLDTLAIYEDKLGNKFYWLKFRGSKSIFDSYTKKTITQAQKDSDEYKKRING